jgi:adenosylmethionine-8-amino-7-oxononanoate aminotransferase
LTGGYLPLAATLTTPEVFSAFLGSRENTFYYGHSYTANQLGCAAALASLDVFEQDAVLDGLPEKIEALRAGLEAITHPLKYEARQCGLVAGLELRNADGERLRVGERTGERVCHAARDFGLLTRPIRDTIVLMPPLCSTTQEIAQACEALNHALEQVWAD